MTVKVTTPDGAQRFAPGAPPPNIRVITPDACTAVIIPQGPPGPDGAGGGGAVTSVAGRTGDVTLTPVDVSLTNVDNTSDANKPVSAAQAAADSAVASAAASALATHTGNTSNPHATTAAQVGLGSVENKSSATIRGEITSGNVTAALGFTPADSATNTGDETVARIGALLHAATTKATPVDADEVTGLDSAASFGLIRMTWANIKATLKTYFDALYPSGSGTHSGTSSGTNTGDNAVNSLYAGLVTNATHTGDVTGSAALTIAPQAVTYAKMQNISATARALGRDTAGAGSAEEVTLTQMLDWIGTAAQGDILYRGASAWANLPAGTSGQFLQTLGAAANPTWATVAGGGGVAPPLDRLCANVQFGGM